jgi:hypothetical protein
MRPTACLLALLALAGAAAAAKKADAEPADPKPDAALGWLTPKQFEVGGLVGRHE